MPPSQLKLFTVPSITRGVSLSLLAKLFGRFTHLLPNKYSLPKPSTDNESYFDSLAQTLEQPSDLPDALIHALHEIEASAAALLAAPDSDSGSDPAETESSCLRQAIQLWLGSHPESNDPAIQQSNAPPTTPRIHQSTNPAPGPSSIVEHPETRIEDHSTNPIIHESINPLSDGLAFERLAQLSPTEYDRIRKSEAKRLNLRIETLDAEVARCKTRLDDAQANTTHLPPVVPWPEPVDGAETLSQTSDRFSLHLVLPPGAADAFALWSAHSHAYTAFPQTPRLNLSSPEPGCGKTTALDVIASLVPRPLRTENLTAPVLFRLVDQYQPTLLLDEVDSYLHQAEELRGLLNAGHKRGSCAYRCEGENKSVRAFKAFAPAVLAGLGPLPGTLADRSIRIPLLPARPEELASRFDSFRASIEKDLCRKLARWAQDNFPALQACDPQLPATAFNRLADNWRPLFAIAQIAGGDWPARALAAFTHLTKVRTESPPSLTKNFGLQPSAFSLLSDIRQIFAQSGATRMPSKKLVDLLCSRADRPWNKARHGKPINGHRLAHRLSGFGIKPSTLRIGDQRAKGYELSDVTNALAQLTQDEFSKPNGDTPSH